MIYIGIDNGTSGSIGVIYGDGSTSFHRVEKEFCKKEQNYTKKKGNITRIDMDKFCNFFDDIADEYPEENYRVMMERPMTNPGRVMTMLNAFRCFEAEIILLETLRLAHVYVDSKEWQKALLPKGVKGSPELKRASLDIGTRMFPQHKELFIKQKDADGMLIAEYCRRFYK